jgi:ribosomal protein S18 acetylase RimI-like enzyme
MAAYPQVQDLRIFTALSPTDIAQVRDLFLEYAQSLGFSLCFQSFDRELAELPGDYAPPRGRLLIASYGGELAGCVALHELEQGIAEMKRLYVRPQYRGKRVGFALVQQLLAEARAIGYGSIRLDTVEPVMKDAVRMYRRLGFREIPSYRTNPIEGALYMQLDL